MTDSTLQSNSVDADVSLAQRFCQGNNAAFDEVIERYSPVLQRLAYRIVGWDGEVDDIVQDVFLSALIHRKKFRAQSSLKTWLFSITINTCRTRNRRHWLRRKFVKQQPIHPESSYNDPVHNSLVKEKIETVRQAARRLPAKFRDVIVLKYLEELPTEQILEILKINKKAFYTRLNRARNYLEENLSEYLENEDE